MEFPHSMAFPWKFIPAKSSASRSNGPEIDSAAAFWVSATAGRCSVCGFDSWTQSVEVRRRVAYLPSELRLYETMTGRRLVRFLADLRGERHDAEAERLAKQLDVPLDKPLTQLSSGMKRKVALLSALLPKVPLIVLDEPTSALDPTMRGQLLDQLVLAKKRGQAVLFSSHVLSEAERLRPRGDPSQRQTRAATGTE
jgi:ABC-2 type transport system ATP-binding protein